MEPTGFFILVDDDPDEHELFTYAVRKLGYTNKVVSFYNGKDALDYLLSTEDEIFMILSDVHMPEMNGLEFKHEIEDVPVLKAKAIPFFFHSSIKNTADIKKAYGLNIQGYFLKAGKIENSMTTIKKIVDFWTDCIHPRTLKHTL